MQRAKQWMCVWLVGLLLLGAFALPVTAASDESLQQTIQDILTWKKNAVGATDTLLTSSVVASAGTSAADWYAMAVGRLQMESGEAYLARLKTRVEEAYRTPDKLDARRATEWHRIALTVLALGGDPTAFGTDESGVPINLIADGVYYRGRTASLGTQGVNGYIWALIALDAGEYAVPADATDTRESLVAALCEAQLQNGGFALDGKIATPDLTAMAVTALAPYDATDTRVHACVERALAYLSAVQNAAGDYSSYGQPNAESTAQVVVALCTLGIDPAEDARFVKEGHGPVEALLAYRTADGGFAHIASGAANSMAGEQSLIALCALCRLRAGQPPFYAMSADQNAAGAGVPFTEADAAAVAALPSPLTGEQYETVLALCEKLAAAPNAAAYEALWPALQAGRVQVEAIRQEVADLSATLAENARRLDEAGWRDRSFVEELTARVEALSAYDREQIVDVEALYRAETRLRVMRRAVWLSVAAVCLVLVVLVVLRQRAKRRRRKKEVTNSEW